jgi:hypothetical protein
MHPKSEPFLRGFDHVGMVRRLISIETHNEGDGYTGGSPFVLAARWDNLGTHWLPLSEEASDAFLGQAQT